MNERAYNTAYIAMAVGLKFREDIDMVCRIACQAENIMYTLGVADQTAQYNLGVFISNDLLKDNEVYRNGDTETRIRELLQEVLTRDQKVELMRKTLEAMMLPKNMAVTANFMFAGMIAGNYSGFKDERYCELLEIWDRGAVELHAELCQYAELSEKIVTFLKSGDTDFDFPGVYDYEVSESFGQWFGDYLLVNKTEPARQIAAPRLADFAATFFNLNEEEKQRLNVFIKELK